MNNLFLAFFGIGPLLFEKFKPHLSARVHLISEGQLSVIILIPILISLSLHEKVGIVVGVRVVSFVVGLNVGAFDGIEVGSNDGDFEGLEVGEIDGNDVGQGSPITTDSPFPY